MESSAINTVEFFKQYIDLCKSSGWPQDNTPREEIMKAFEAAEFVELSMKKFKSTKNGYQSILALLHQNQNFSRTFLLNCMSDPPKYILKKIVNSDAQVNVIDIAFEIFTFKFSEERLVEAMSDLMVEAASKDTLIKNMSESLTEGQQLEVTNKIHLYAVLECDSEELFTCTLKNCSQEFMDSLVLCLVRDDMRGIVKEDTRTVRGKIIIGFTNIMTDTFDSAETFWETLFKVDKDNLIEMCLQYRSLCVMIFEGLLNKYLSIENNCEDVEINSLFSIQKIKFTFNILLGNETLKSEFVKFMKHNPYENLIDKFVVS